MWLPTKDLEDPKKSRPSSRSGALAATLICVLMMALLWVVPKDGPTARAVINYTLPNSGVGSSLRSTLPGWQIVRLRDDFDSGLRDWVGAGSALDWTREGSAIRPGRLRLWAPSLKLADYQFEFEGQIEQKAMSWTFRSGDLGNYYATKLSMASPAPAPRAAIVRYVVLNGKERDRIELPLPPAVLDETLYHVKVNVKGAYFVTSINGQVVDSWYDRRLTRGGVGFFADKGEVAAIRWVSVNTAAPGFFSRLFASTLFVPPGL